MGKDNTKLVTTNDIISDSHVGRLRASFKARAILFVYIHQIRNALFRCAVEVTLVRHVAIKMRMSEKLYYFKNKKAYF